MVGRSLVRWGLIVAATCAAAADAGAQTGVRASRSMTLSAGVGSGAATFNCTACLPERQLSVAGKLRAGMTLTSAWTIGLEGSLWAKRFQRPDGHSSAQLGFADLSAHWYPGGGSKFFVSGGAGLALFHETIGNSGVPSVTVHSVSPAFILGLGWDLPVSERWAVTPYVDFLTGPASSVSLDAAGGQQRFRPALVQVGLAFTHLPGMAGADVQTAPPVAARPFPSTSGFRAGDRIMMTVVGEPQLSDTFTVVAGPAIRVPVIGTVPLRGVTDVGLEHYLSTYIARYVRNPVVHATAMIRLGVLGEVAHPGFYAFPSHALLADVLMAAGGPTQNARVNDAYVSRSGAARISSDSLHRAIAAGLTIGQVGVRSGDELLVPRIPTSDRTSQVIGLLVTVPAAILAIMRFR